MKYLKRKFMKENVNSNQIKKPTIPEVKGSPWEQFWKDVRAKEEYIVDLADRNQLQLLIDVLKIKNEQLPIDINSKNGLNGWSAIHFAGFNNNIEMIKVLIEYGGNINQKTKTQSNLLHIAVQIKSLELVRYLLEQNIEKDIQDDCFNTPLHLAAEKNSHELIELLLKAGCNHSIKNQQLLEPVHLVTQPQALDIFQRFGVNTTSPSKRRKINDQIVMISKFDTKLKILNACKIKGLNQSNKENITSSKIKVKNLRILGALGSGTFGQVFKVYDPERKEFYALKCIERNKIQNYKIQQYLITEKEILKNVVSQYTVQLKGTFQTDQYLCILETFVSGTDLHQYIIEHGSLSETETALIAYQVTKGLHDLHEQGYIYRDLKPHNIMHSKEGRVKLIDFGLCKKIREKAVTHSFCGSIAYLAPEMIKREGHNQSLDMYLLGVLIYEMLHGEIPFFDKNKNMLLLNIMNSQLNFKKSLSPEAVDIIQLLMNRNKEERPNTKDILKHKFFENANLFGLNDYSNSPLKKKNLAHEQLKDLKTLGQFLNLDVILKQPTEQWDWNTQN